MGTETVNNIADVIINGDKSNFNLSKQAYMSMGMSEEEATRQAYADIAKNVAYSGAAGAVSGGIMGAGASAFSRFSGNNSVQTNPKNALGLQDNTAEQSTSPVEVAESQQATNVGKTVNGDNTQIELLDGVHTVEQLKTMEEYKRSSNSQIGVWAERKRSGQKAYKYLPVATVNDTVADLVMQKYGLDIHGNSIGLNNSSLNHIDKEHINNNSKSPLGNEDLERIGYVLENPDEVALTDETTTATRTKDNHFAPKIVVRKRIDGHYYIVEAVTDATTGQDVVVTAFIEEVGKESSEYKELFKGAYHVPSALDNSSPLAHVRNVHENNSSNESISNLRKAVNKAEYSTKKIDGFDELNKALDRLVGMYKGNENTQNLYSQMKAAVNEYVQTGNQDAIDMAVTLASDIDDTLVGHSYTRKGSGKNSAKSQNNRVTTTFSKGEFADTFMSYSKSLWDAARNRSNNTNDNVAHDSDVVERIASMREDGNQRKRSYNDTLINKTDAPQELKNEFINNPDMYTQLSNAETSAKADAILANNDIDSAIAQYHSMLDAKDPAAVPLGYNLSKQLSQAGRLDESVQLVRDMSKALTESGQFSQAAAITMLNNDPEAAKRYLVREIDTMNQKGKERYGKKWTDFELTESELQQFNDIKSGDTEGIKALYENVYNRLRKQYPSTMTEKFMEFRRMSMLLNVRTNVRNIVSNALVMPVRWTADRVSALGEGVYSLINPKYQRTQSISPVRSKQAKKLASDAFETVRTELLGDNKYEDAKGAVRDKQIFKGSKTAQMLDNITNGAVTKANAAMGKDINPSLMETARNFTYHLLEKGDDVFVRKNFESRMASYIEAQGITDLENIPADAYTLATQEAFKATFKDDSALANCLSTFRQMLNKAPGNFIGEAIMPFTKTPANLAMRGIDYSPAGFFKGVNTLKNAKNNADYAKGITQLGQAATGTAAIALGYALAESGFLKGDLSDDKDEAQFQKQQGELAYSVKTPLGYFTYDWAQPASIPLILGVAIHDSLENDKGLASGLLQGTLAAVDSWLKLSPLQNLSDIFGGYGTPAENVWEVLSTDLPLSFIPTQLGAAARIGDTTQRVTYDQNSDLNNLVNQAKAKIPGLSKTLPVAYDTWGNPIQRQDNIGEA